MVFSEFPKFFTWILSLLEVFDLNLSVIIIVIDKLDSTRAYYHH